ncbi:MAG: response regulator transcription factor [Phototrophicaceae bacterium]
MPYVIAVDDEADVLATLGRTLERDDMVVKLVNVSSEAQNIIEKEHPDLVILDIIMPEVDGITICKRLRNNAEFASLPILFLTAKGRIDDIVAGLDAGADDYIVKPFHIAELRARVEALLRRGWRGTAEENKLVLSGLELDSQMHQVCFKDQCVQLTSTEHRLLRYLLNHVGKALSPLHLLEHVWDYPPQMGDPDLVRAHIRNLRAKLKQISGKRYIETVHGVGYLIEAS